MTCGLEVKPTFPNRHIKCLNLIVTIRRDLNNMNNNKVKIVEANKGKHMAVLVRLIPLLHQRKTQVEHTLY